HIVTNRVIGAGVDLRPAIAEMAAVEGKFWAEMAAQPEAARRVEQIVAPVIADGERQGSDEEAACVLEPGIAEDAALDRSEPLTAVGPGPFLLPDEVALPLDIGGKVDRLGRVSGVFLMRRRDLQVQRLVA